MTAMKEHTSPYYQIYSYNLSFSLFNLCGLSRAKMSVYATISEICTQFSEQGKPLGMEEEEFSKKYICFFLYKEK